MALGSLLHTSNSQLPLFVIDFQFFGIMVWEHGLVDIQSLEFIKSSFVT